VSWREVGNILIKKDGFRRSELVNFKLVATVLIVLTVAFVGFAVYSLAYASSTRRTVVVTGSGGAHPTSASGTVTSSATIPAAVDVQVPSGASDNQTSFGNLGFYPNAIRVVIGVNNTVVWTNNDAVMHTVTSLSIPTGAQAFNDVLGPGSKYSLTFTVPGTYRYHCNIHPWMFGVIIVES